MSAMRIASVLVFISALFLVDFVSTSSARDELNKSAVGRYHPGTGAFIGKVQGETKPNQANVYVYGIDRDLEFAKEAAFEVEGELMPVHPPSEEAAMIPFTAKMVMTFIGEPSSNELVPSEAKFYDVRLRRDRF